MLLTVVVPACRCARYLPQLFTSLDAQTVRDFEVIFSVEHSDDGSLEMCRDWNPRAGIKKTVLDLPCTGTGGASRNRAFDVACGDYLVPLDGDDWLDPEALKALADGIVAAGEPEVVNVAARIVQDDGKGELTPLGTISNLSDSDDGIVLSGIEFLRRVCRRGHCKNHGALVVVRADYLRTRRLYQLEGVPSEDSEWTPRVLSQAQRILFLATPRYNYRRHADSVSSAGTSDILFATASISIRLAGFLETAGLPDDVRRFLGNDALSIFNWYLFHRAYSKRFSPADRHRALDIVFADAETSSRYQSLWQCASRWKRVAWPLVVLAQRTGMLFPATLYFRWFYYPLTGLLRRWRAVVHIFERRSQTGNMIDFTNKVRRP